MHLEYIPASVPSIMCSLPREYRVHAKSGGEHEVQGSDTRNMKRVQDKKDTHEEGYEHIKSKLEGSQQGECGNKEAKTEKESRPNKKTQEQNVNPLRPNEGAFFFCPDSFLKRT